MGPTQLSAFPSHPNIFFFTAFPILTPALSSYLRVCHCDRPSSSSTPTAGRPHCLCFDDGAALLTRRRRRGRARRHSRRRARRVRAWELRSSTAFFLKESVLVYQICWERSMTVAGVLHLVWYRKFKFCSFELNDCD